MGLSNPTHYFGIHSILFYRRSNKLAYGAPIKVAGGFNLDLPTEFADLTGGSEKFTLASEVTTITPEATVSLKEFRLYLYELFLGATTSSISAEAAGNVSAMINKLGTSVLDATTGIASVTALVGSEANLKFAKYVIKSVTPTTVNIYASSDIDFGRGSAVDYQSDELELLASDLVIADTGATQDVTELGITLTSGSGTIAMTANDTAIFDVRPINSGSDIITIGESGKILPEFGCILYGQQRSNGEMVEIEIYKALGGGMPHNFEEKSWVESELTIKPLKDFTENKVFEIRRVRPA